MAVRDTTSVHFAGEGLGGTVQYYVYVGILARNCWSGVVNIKIKAYFWF